MEFLIAGLLTADLAVTLAGIYILERRAQRQSASLNETLKAFLAEEARTADSLRSVWTRLKPLEKLASDVDTLLARDVASEIVEQMEQRLKDAPSVLSAQEEVQLSRAMEEGLASILGYSPGRGGEAGT